MFLNAFGMLILLQYINSILLYNKYKISKLGRLRQIIRIILLDFTFWQIRIQGQKRFLSI